MATWSAAFTASPADSDDASEGAERIRELKEAVQERIVHEHDFDTSSGAVANHGWHKAGAAKGYYQSAEPTNRPDGTTSLTSDDAGRYWTDSDDGKLYVYTGSAWDALTAGTTVTDELASLTAAEVQQLQNIGTTTLSAAIWEQVGNIGSVTISATQWGYLGDLDQALATTDDVTFNSVTGTIAASNVTEISNLTAAEGAQLENINSATISNTQWGYVGNLNQNLRTTDDVSFDDLTLSGRYDVGTNSRYLEGSKTGNEVFDALKAYIPDDDDEMALTGGYGQNGSDAILVCGRAVRISSSRIDIRSVRYTPSGGPAGNTDSALDGDSNSFCDHMSMAW